MRKSQTCSLLRSDLSAVCIRAAQFPHPSPKWMDEGVCSQSGLGERHHRACPRKKPRSPQGPVAHFHKEPKTLLLAFAKLFFLSEPPPVRRRLHCRGGGGTITKLPPCNTIAKENRSHTQEALTRHTYIQHLQHLNARPYRPLLP